MELRRSLFGDDHLELTNADIDRLIAGMEQRVGSLIVTRKRSPLETDRCHDRPKPDWPYCGKCGHEYEEHGQPGVRTCRAFALITRLPPETPS